MPFSDAGNQSVLATQGISSRFFHHIGATRLLRNICGPTVGAGVAMTNGTGLGGDPLQLEHSKLILLWATNTKLTNRHLWPVIEKARANGAKVVVIDPIRTLTAEDGRPVHPAAAGHRHRDDAGDDARHHPRRPGRSRLGRRSHPRVRRTGRARHRLDARQGGRSRAASTPT